MARQDINEALAQTGFLYGGNAAYIEDLYARYQADPNSVDEQWRGFFAGLKDDGPAIIQNAKGASWTKPNWPIHANGELISALDGHWGVVEKVIGDKLSAKAKAAGATLSASDVQQATRDSVRAIMLIRAYRMRGHLHAKLDPLDIEQARDPEELSPTAFGFTDADLDRKIFIDNVLGMEFASLREMVAILQRTYCNTIGIEFMHISDPEQKAWLQERIEGPDKEIAFTREGKKAILNN